MFFRFPIYGGLPDARRPTASVAAVSESAASNHMRALVLHRPSGFVCALASDVMCQLFSFVSCSRSALWSLASAPYNLLPSSVLHPPPSLPSVSSHAPHLSPHNVLGRFYREECPPPVTPLHHPLCCGPNAHFDPQGSRNRLGFLPGNHLWHPGAHEDASASQAQWALPAS